MQLLKCANEDSVKGHAVDRSKADPNRCYTLGDAP
jgi:hypothetical protein